MTVSGQTSLNSMSFYNNEGLEAELFVVSN